MRKELAYFACFGLLLGCGDRGADGTGNGADRGGNVAGGTGPGGSGGGGTSAGAGADPGTVVTTTEPAGRAQEGEALERDLSDLASLDATSLRERFPTSFADAPTYDPDAILGLDAIQASSLALSATELEALSAKGFVISGEQAFPTFGLGYATIYLDDLPVYVSADSILEAVHRSYDQMLKQLEMTTLGRELSDLLSGMRSRLAGGVGTELGGVVRADVDTYLAVATSLLDGSSAAPVAGGDAAAIALFVEDATSASGSFHVSLFGTDRYEDFSQFTPRGHYTESEELRRYFRAMMWLGRIDFRLLETQEDGTRIFRRRQLEGMLLLDQLVDDALRPHFERIDDAVRVFVGEPDYMQLSEVQPLLADAGVSSLEGVAAVSDPTWAQTILDGGYGLQRISSAIMVNGLGSGTLPLSLSFALFGQRYVIDSHVFSNVVYDRAGHGTVERMLPNPLDVAFAVLQNDQAAELLTPELEHYAYAPDLAAMRVLADRHPPGFWSENLYNLWLGALRELGPAAIARSTDAAALPATFQSEPWGRRLLNAELASWSELRHDSLLYAKQSFTGGSTCEFPDGYVDPYPEFYAKLAEYATVGKETVDRVTAASMAPAVDAYFDNLSQVAARLHDMATYQRSGAPYTQEMLDFLNDAVVVSQGCGDPSLQSGWYRKLFYEPDDGVDWAPTIADVHTQPLDLEGNPVGNVLHVGTGDARLMVVVADTCSGPRAYAGLASSYYEHLTTDFERLDDPTWESMVRDEPDVPWMADLVTR